MATAADGERKLAALVHVGSIFGPLWVPLIAWFWQRRKSEYVAAHAWQAIRDLLFLNVILVTIGLISLVMTITSINQHYQEGWENFSIWPVLVKFAVVWIIVAILGLINTVQSVIQAMKALRGDWPRHSIRAAKRSAITRS